MNLIDCPTKIVNLDMLAVTAKGQLISECPLDVLNFPKTNEKI